MIFIYKISILINTNNNNNTSIKRIRIYNYLKYKIYMILNKFNLCFVPELFLSILKILIFLEFQSLKDAYTFRNLRHIKQNMNIFLFLIKNVFHFL